jgi:hypothetical protein
LFTAPYTPEKNGGVEQKVTSLFGKVRSMLNRAHLTKALRNGLWDQSAEIATHLENILVSGKGEKTASDNSYVLNF